MSNEELAFEVIQACWRAGCREFVVCAGSQNSPLVLRLMQLAESSEELRIWNFFEERSAAFFALGRSKAGGQPSAVVTTSGSAVAELLPAAVEAHFADIPLILVTADRPHKFIDSGFPQTINQKEIIKNFTENNIDISGDDLVALERLGRRAADVERWHVNVRFDDPLFARPGICSSDFSLGSAGTAPQGKARARAGEELAAFIGKREGLVVLLGSLGRSQGAPALARWLEGLGCPVWAEAGSGLREDERLSGLVIRSGERYFVRQPPAKVLRIGDVPSLRFWRDLEEMAGTEVLSVNPPNGYAGLARESQVLACDLASAIETCPMGAGGEPVDLADDRGDWGRMGALLEKYPQSEPAWIGRLSREIPEGSLVFLGNSMPIREWNLAAGYEARGLRCFASRGVNGIDGQVSTFFGLTVGEEESWGVFGDLTAMYDLSAPWVVGQLGAGRRRVVVVNNKGGGIFSRLPHLAGLPEGKKEVTENRHQRSFEHWAAMWDLEYRKVVKPGDLSMEDIGLYDSILIELCPDAGQTEDFWRELAQAVLPSE